MNSFNKLFALFSILFQIIHSYGTLSSDYLEFEFTSQPNTNFIDHRKVYELFEYPNGILEYSLENDTVFDDGPNFVAIVDHVIEGDSPYSKSNYEMLIDNFPYNSKPHGYNLRTSHEKILTNRNENCRLGSFSYSNQRYNKILGISFCPTLKGPGRMSYLLDDKLDILDYCSIPKLKLDFADIMHSFNIDISVIDRAGVSHSYTPMHCSSDNRTYEIDLFSDNNPVDFHTLKSINLKFYSESNVHENHCFLSSIGIVPEPFSIITLSTGIAAFIKKRNLKRNKQIKH